MNKGNKKFLILLKFFVLFSCPLIFGKAEPEVSDTIINPSEVYIPKEDLNEDFKNKNSKTPEEDSLTKPTTFNNEKSNNLEFKDLEELQRLDNSKSKNNSLYGKELQFPKYLKQKKSSFEQPNVNDLKSRSNIDELRIRIEKYENKIENLERLLNNENIKSIQRKDEEYKALAKSLKREIEEIKFLINKKENLLSNNSKQQKNTYKENVQKYDNNNEETYDYNQKNYIPNTSYNYKIEDNKYYKKKPQHFHSEAQVIKEINDKITNNEDAINNNSHMIKEINDKITNNEDAINNNSHMIKEINDKITNNEDAINNNSHMIKEINDKITNNEDVILDLQKELTNLQKSNNLEDIELNLSSIEKIINELKEKIEQTENLYKESEDKINNNQNEINVLEKRLEKNENTISALQEKYKNRNLLTKEHKEAKNKQENEISKIQYKNNFKEQNKKNKTKNTNQLSQKEPTIKKITHKNTEKTTGIKPASFQIYPDKYLNNYNFKGKGNNFAFRKPDKYYVEIEPTKNLYRAKEIYNLISKHHIKNYFINPSLKHKETFFRNLIEIENTNEIDSLYKNLESDFKDIRIIK
ncbi:hypothetical protein F0310_02730 [Borrelia sp. A-FGy1]|uniref:hypothetical protein n=1 Tax=Borrelia sp. A-FGy1 TaxID=2608247 RepID=UPI0015F40582|nr:hypothetical protein [Borrelia sp. A-FGy1]QMU99319.1 hypothetical protein F0310_02730 [Borrelia sp. A-FGy1]